MEKSNPPTGAPNAAETPAAAPAETKFLLQCVMKVIMTFLEPKYFYDIGI